MHPTDEEYVALWRRGDEGAALELVRRHTPALGRYLRSRCADDADLDDLLQEVFFRAFQGLDGWRGDAPLRGWLFRIAVNHLRDQHRRRGGRVMLTLLDDDRADPGDPALELEARESLHLLQAGMAALSPMQREVFRLRVEDGLDYAEVAAALETTTGAARVHYHHAVKRLKEHLR
ncbi:MAG TPA: RNA polymerase sigma factor [Gemmatimonadales bacterium]|nr:RNA polymerase sigma factor [Gemmatimonadales bacterium]